MSLRGRAKYFNNSLQLLLKLTQRFGARNGASLFFKIRKKQLDNLVLNGISQPISMRAGTVDLNIFRHVIINEDYQIKFSFTPQTIIDGGAYIGLSTAYFANQYPDAKIIAIEPDDENHSLLTRNTTGYKNVIAIHSGLWYENTLIKNHKIDNHHCGNTIEVTTKDDPTALQSTSIDSIVNKFNLTSIDILKLDIEGAEKELFSINMDSWLPLTKSIIIEIHDHKNPGSSKAVFEALIKHSFRLSGVRGENLIFEKNT